MNRRTFFQLALLGRLWRRAKPLPLTGRLRLPAWDPGRYSALPLGPLLFVR